MHLPCPCSLDSWSRISMLPARSSVPPIQSLLLLISSGNSLPSVTCPRRAP